ncbi:MAG: DUF6603 domain-containing protein [Thermodesulfobacteriota bacterium]
MSGEGQFVPLRLIIPWPEENFPLQGDNAGQILDFVGISSFSIQQISTGWELEISLVVLQKLLFGVPGLDGVEVLFGSHDGRTVFAAQLNIGQKNVLTLKNLSVALRFPPSWFKSMKQEGNTFVENRDANGNLASFQIELEGFDLAVSGEDFDMRFPSGAPIISLPPGMIGDTGVVIEAEGISFIFSEEASVALPTSIPASSRGILISNALIHLPKDISVAMPSDVKLDDFFIGSGGFCGKATGTWTPQLNSTKTEFTGNGAGNIFGIAFALREISLEFKQNTFVESKIEGAMILPFFDQPVVCSVNLTNDGDFTVALAADQTLPPGVTAPEQSSDGLFVFTKEELIKLKLKSIAFKKENNLFSITLGGDIKPLLGGIDWPEVEIKALTIDSKGNVRVDGGWIEIPKQAALDFHGFKLELTKIGFGNEEDGSRWIGFSGGINIVEGIPLKGGVDGLKLIWKEPVTDLSNIRMKISGINVAFEVEDVLKFDGRVYFIDEGTKKGFKGGVKLTIDPLDGMMLDAQFIAGRNELSPPYNFFYIYIAAELPIGIPLGSTGAALFGMAGLFGYNTTVDKRDSEAWFENNDGAAGFYLRPEKGITSVTKWTDRRDALALGAGLTLGTASDNGFTFAGKVLLVILIPGPMILIEGKAQFLKERKSLNDDPIFRMLAVLDTRAGTFLFNVQAQYKYPEDGKVIEIGGTAEAFFNFNNPNAWHFYIGQDTPEAKRIRAKILSLFNANSYFMIDANGLKIGAWIGYDKSWKFGPLSVVLQACIEGMLALSTKPPQAAGALTLHGNVQLKAFGRGVGLSVSAAMAAKAPTPWYVFAEFKVKLNLPWPLPDPKATVTLEWQSPAIPPWPVPLAKVGIEHLKVTEKWELEKYPVFDPDKDGYLGPGQPVASPSNPWISSPIIPLDARPVLTFSRPIKDIALEYANPRPVPSPERVGDYTFEYRLTKISLHKRPKSGPSSSWTLVATSDGESPRPLFGAWQVVTDPVYGNWQGDSDSASPTNTKLMLWTTSPFEISRELENNNAWRYSILSSFDGYPCISVKKSKKLCVDFKGIPSGSTYNMAYQREDFLFYSYRNYLCVEEYEGAWAETDRTLQVKYIKAEDEVVCLDFTKLKPARMLKEIDGDGVLFTASELPDGETVYLEVADKFPSGGDGRNDIWIGWSEEKASSLASICFTIDIFAEGPDAVTIECGHYKHLMLRAYDEEQNVVAEVEHTAGQNVLQQLVLRGNKPIRRIDIIGSEIAISRLCYIYKGMQAPDLLIVMPEEMASVELYLAQGSKGVMEVLLEDNTVIDAISFDIPPNTTDGEMKPVDWKMDDFEESFRAVVLKGSFRLLKVCVKTKAEVIRENEEAEVLTRLRNSVEEYWGMHEACVLEPNHYYKLSVATEIERRKDSDRENKVIEESSYFQTGNPPGAYDPADFPAPAEGQVDEYGNVEHYPVGGPLKDPSVYIQSTIPVQTASNEKQCPVYRSYDVGIEFNESKSYIDQMYLMAGLPLRVQLFDNNDQPVLDASGNPIVMKNMWSDNPSFVTTKVEEQWKVTLKANCHIDVSYDRVEHSTSLFSGAKGLAMKPSTIYKAKIYAGQYKVYQFSFITSRYCTFAHHIHSFIDAVWDYHRLQTKLGLFGGGFSPDIDTKIQAILAGLEAKTTYAPRFENETLKEGVRFEQLMDIFGLTSRSLPERVEVTVINDENKAYAFLLESPEPIVWDRIQMGIKFYNDTITVNEASGLLKIIGANISASSSDSTDYNEEWIEFILQERYDLNGLSILHKTAPDAEYAEYYWFQGEKILPAGTIVRVHSGRQTDQPQDEREHRFRAKDEPDEKWQFDSAGEWLALEGAGDENLHNKNITSTAGTEQEFILLRNADHTRAFVILKDGLINGRYRFEFEFYRKQERQPILKRMGLEDMEKTFIEFNYPPLLPV